MRKSIVLAGLLFLSGCSSPGYYVDQLEGTELDEYCPEYLSGSMTKSECDDVVYTNMNAINQKRVDDNRKAREATQARVDKAYKERMELIDKKISVFTKKYKTEYEGDFSSAIGNVMSGGEFERGIYKLDTTIKISFCSYLFCYGRMDWNDFSFSMSGFKDPLEGSYVYGGYAFAYVSNGKIQINKVME